MRKALRWFRRIVLTVLALAVIAFATVAIALHTDWGREKVRAQVEAALADQFPGAQVGKLEGSVFGELVIRDLELRDALGHPAVTVKTLRVEIALLPLLHHTARIDRVIAEDVALLGIPAQAPPSPPPATPAAPNKWSVDLPEVHVYRGSVRLPAVGIDSLDLDASASLPAGAPITASATVRGTWVERNAPFGVYGDVRVDNQHVEIPQVTATLGGISLAGSNILLAALSGRIVVTAPAAAVTKLEPTIVLPGDVHATIDALPVGNATQLAIEGNVGAAEIRGYILGDVEERHAIGTISARAPELRELTRGAMIGSGGILATLDGGLAAIRGLVIFDGQPAGGPRGSGGVIVAGAGDLGHVLVLADAGATTAVIADFTRKGEDIAINHGTLFVHSRDLASLTTAIPQLAGKLHGSVHVQASVAGKLAPVLALEVVGRASGERTAFGAMGAQTMTARFDANLKRGKVIEAPPAKPVGPAKPIDAAPPKVTIGFGPTPLLATGHAHVELAGLANGSASYGRVTIDAANHVDGTIDAHVHAEPRPLVAIDVGGVVTPGAAIKIDLGPHQVTAQNQQWSGTGGHIAIDSNRITINGFRTTSRTSSVSIDGDVGRDSGDLSAKIALAHLDISGFDPRYSGVIDGRLALDRKRGRWSGTGQFAAAAVTVDGRPPMDGDVHLDVAGRRVTLEGHLGNPAVGSVELALDVDGPRELIDVAGWRNVDRRDVRLASIVLHTIALARLDPAGTGIVDGSLVMTGADTHGLLNVKGVQTVAGEIGADITLAPAGGGQIAAVAEATMTGVGTADLGGLLAVPDHLFDPEAWRALGRNAIRAASAQLDDLAFDPTVLGHFKVNAPYRGTVAASVAIGPGAASSQITVDVHGVEGGSLLQPIDLHAETKLDESGTIAEVVVRSAKAALVQLHGSAPLTFGRVLAVGGSFDALRDVPVVGTVSLPSAQLKDLLAMVGRTDIASGTTDGTIAINGTLGTPTAQAQITARDVAVTSRTSNQATATLNELLLVGNWGGAAGTVTLTGKESSGGTLRATASGGTDLAGMIASLDVAKFDLAPLAAFLPGSAGAAAGTLDASVNVHGFDLPTSHISGQAHIVDGRMPLSPTIGSLWRATVDLALADRAVSVKVDGNLGSGTVHLEGTGDLTKIDMTGKLKKISIINALQPQLTADVAAHLRHDTRWTGAVIVRNATIMVPAESGTKLLATSAPSDLIFIDGSNKVPPPPIFGTEPPWLVLDFDIGSTQLDLNLLGGDLVVTGSVISPKLVVSYGGDGVGLVGAIDSESAAVDLFGHRYDVDPAGLTFTGTTDPELKITMTHDFTGSEDVTLIVDIKGTGSNPEILFSSQPGTYAQSQLLGFFLGGEPGGDPNNATRDAAAGAGASLASSAVGRKLGGLVGVRFDLKCEAATAATSNSCAVGKWITQKLYGVVNYHQGALPLENNSELQLQYYMLKSLLLEGTVGDKQLDGIDLLWRHRW